MGVTAVAEKMREIAIRGMESSREAQRTQWQKLPSSNMIQEETDTLAFRRNDGST